MIEDARQVQSQQILEVLGYQRFVLSIELEKIRPRETTRGEWVGRISYWDSLAADDYANYYPDEVEE